MSRPSSGIPVNNSNNWLTFWHLHCFCNIAVKTKQSTACLFCGNGLSFWRRLIHGRYCNQTHKRKFRERLDHLAWSQLIKTTSLTMVQSMPKS